MRVIWCMKSLSCLVLLTFLKTRIFDFSLAKSIEVSMEKKKDALEILIKMAYKSQLIKI